METYIKPDLTGGTSAAHQKGNPSLLHCQWAD